MVGFLLTHVLVGSDACNTQSAIEGVSTEDFITMYKKGFLDAEDDFLGEERLARVGGGADGVAATAFGAGVAVEQLLPGELLGPGDAVVFAFLKVLYGGQGTLGSIVAQEDVERCCHQVQVLGARQVDQEAQHGDDVYPPEGAIQDDVGIGSQAAEPGADP